MSLVSVHMPSSMLGSGGTTVTSATGATAAGAFTPAGAAVPANLAALTGITASPATAWTTGQAVVLADGSSASWNGTAWVGTVAPAPPAPAPDPDPAPAPDPDDCDPEPEPAPAPPKGHKPPKKPVKRSK